MAMEMRPRRQAAGFSLIEVMIVVVLIAAIMAVLIPTLGGDFGRGLSNAADVLAAAGPGALATPAAGGCLPLAASVARSARDATALRTITIDAARALGVDARVGSLDVGKDADLVILSGEPFVPGTRVLRVMVDGRFIDGQEER